MTNSKDKNIEDELQLLKNFNRFDKKKLFIRLIQSNHIEDPYRDVYLKTDEKGNYDDESIYRWCVWKTKRRIVHKDQLVIPLLKKSKDTWLFINILKIIDERELEDLKPEERNNKYGYQSSNYELIENIEKYSKISKKIKNQYQKLEIKFHRTRKEQWPLIPYNKIYKKSKCK